MSKGSKWTTWWIKVVNNRKVLRISKIFAATRLMRDIIARNQLVAWKRPNSGRLDRWNTTSGKISWTSTTNKRYKKQKDIFSQNKSTKYKIMTIPIDHKLDPFKFPESAVKCSPFWLKYLFNGLFQNLPLENVICCCKYSWIFNQKIIKTNFWNYKLFNSHLLKSNFSINQNCNLNIRNMNLRSGRCNTLKVNWFSVRIHF